jgi:hypothetical protein
LFAASHDVRANADQKPYILVFGGACSASEMAIEYFIAGEFGGYSSFVRTDGRFEMYEIPTVRNGLPAKSLKIIVRGARCRTQTFDIPDVEPEGRVIRAKLRRSRRTEFEGVIRTAEQLRRKEIRLTVEYWAHWKCGFFGITDCLVGPTRIDVADVNEDGRFKVLLPDIGNDAALAGFPEKGSFQLFIRNRKSGEILYKLKGGDGSRGVPVSPPQIGIHEFHLEAPEK